MNLSAEALAEVTNVKWFNGWNYRGTNRDSLNEFKASFMQAFPDGNADTRSLAKWLAGEDAVTFLFYNLCFGVSAVHHELYEHVEEAVRNALLEVASASKEDA